MREFTGYLAEAWVMLMFLQLWSSQRLVGTVFSRRVVGRGNVWQLGVADEKTPRKIGFRAWLRGFLDCMTDMFFFAVPQISVGFFFKGDLST